MKKKPDRTAEKGKPAPAGGEPERVALRCAGCGTALTPTLRRIPGARPITQIAGAEILPRGFYWEAPADFWPQTEPGAWVVNPADVAALAPVGDRSGCCGPSGGGGPNLACPSGHRVATEVTDCWAPHMILIAPSATVSVLVEGEEPRGRVLVAGSAGPLLSEEAFSGWVHEALDAADWYGNNLCALVREWLTRTESTGETVCVVWLNASASARAGVPVSAIEAAFEKAQESAQNRRITLCLGSSGRA